MNLRNLPNDVLLSSRHELSPQSPSWQIFNITHEPPPAWPTTKAWFQSSSVHSWRLNICAPPSGQIAHQYTKQELVAQCKLLPLVTVRWQSQMVPGNIFGACFKQNVDLKWGPTRLVAQEAAWASPLLVYLVRHMRP